MQGVETELRQVLEGDPRIAYAIVFGSAASGKTHAHSDVDVALEPLAPLTRHEVGDLIGRLEQACGRPVDLVLLDGAAPAIAYRVFRDGRPLFVTDRAAFVRRKQRAIMEYLDFEPLERRFVEATLRPGHGR